MGQAERVLTWRWECEFKPWAHKAVHAPGQLTLASRPVWQVLAVCRGGRAVPVQVSSAPPEMAFGEKKAKKAPVSDLGVRGWVPEATWSEI